MEQYGLWVVVRCRSVSGAVPNSHGTPGEQCSSRQSCMFHAHPTHGFRQKRGAEPNSTLKISESEAAQAAGEALEITKGTLVEAAGAIKTGASRLIEEQPTLNAASKEVQDVVQETSRLIQERDRQARATRSSSSSSTTTQPSPSPSTETSDPPSVSTDSPSDV